MPNYVILNTVKTDGVGDFSHFEDIVKAIKANSKFADVELFLLVLFEENAERFSNCPLYTDLLIRTHNLGCHYVFGTLNEHEAAVCINVYLRHQLQQASQVLIVSYDKLFEFYEPYFKQSAVIKYISEHDGLMNQQKSIVYPRDKVKYPRELLMRGMGLSSNCYGVKIKDIPNLTFNMAVETIQNSDPNLFSNMINCAGAKDLEELLKDNIIIPAYFSCDYKFAYFIALVSQNYSIHEGKNIIIYHSGTNFNNANLDMRHQYYIKHILEYLAECNTQVYSQDSITPNLVYSNKDSATITVRVFSGFSISNCSYQALYKLAPLVGVSGDNTFELAVTSKVLPVYWSTNPAFKEQTFVGLRNILIKADLGLDGNVINAFLKFFELCKENGDDYKLFKFIDFQKLKRYWPVVAEHIKRHYNFYDRLENIVCENLTHHALPSKVRFSSLRGSQASSWPGFFERIFGSDITAEGCQRQIRKLPI